MIDMCVGRLLPAALIVSALTALTLESWGSRSSSGEPLPAPRAVHLASLARGQRDPPRPPAPPLDGFRRIYRVPARERTVPPPLAPAGSPVARNGQLAVCGTKLCDQDGRPVQLRGMSTHGLQWYGGCVNAGSLDALARDWKADVLRIAVYVHEGGYAEQPRRFTELAHRLIEEITARGMYVLIDWHTLTPGDPNRSLGLAETFFTEIARHHDAKPNLLYEIANEPNGVSWPRIKSYAEKLIPAIRRHDPDAPILVGTRAWSSLGVTEGASEAEVVNDPVDAANIMYTFHFYAASHGAPYLAALSRAADRIPVFVTEFGTQEYTGAGGDLVRARRYLDLMARKQIGWVNWNYSDSAAFKEGTCPRGPWTGTAPLRSAGAWVRAHIMTPDRF